LALFSCPQAPAGGACATGATAYPKHAAELLRAMLEYKGHIVTRTALALSALVFLRPGELRQIEWAWVDLDAAMVIPPSRSPSDWASPLR
jgi:integrase